MQRNTLAFMIFLTIPIVSAIAPREGAVVMDLNNKENIVASRLAGDWKFSIELSKRLQPSAPASAELTFTVDATAVPQEKLEKLAAALKKKNLKGDLPVYLVGKLKMGAKEYPSFLTNLNGNPHLVMFREKNGDPMGDVESSNLTIAVAREKMNDVLYVGGDFNNQPFSAFERVK